jgi:glycosyltransferase involved in cell wall biosynthesis
MKYLFLSDVRFDNPKSGSEQVLYQQITGLSKKNHSIIAITRENGNSFNSGISENDNILNAHYSVDLRHKYRTLFALLKEPPRLFQNLNDKEQLAVAISHQPFTCFSLLVDGKLRHIPLIYVFHSPNHEEYILSGKTLNYFGRILVIQLRRMIEKFCMLKAERIMVLSQFMKQKIIDLHRISHDRVTVNPGGADLDRFKPIESREFAKKDLGFKKNYIHLLTVRNLEPRMGIDNLLKSTKILKQRLVQIHLTIGGEGPEKENLQKLIKKLDLMDEVSLTGFIPAEQLPRFYAAADFFILPTRQLEGFGLVTPESMACGTPVIGTPVGGTKEILSDFNYNLLCRDYSPKAIADGIQKSINLYFNDRKIYKNLRMSCREHIKRNYSWLRHINQLNSLIHETLGGVYNKIPN